jgi:hypothetical protein
MPEAKSTDWSNSPSFQFIPANLGAWTALRLQALRRAGWLEMACDDIFVSSIFVPVRITV